MNQVRLFTPTELDPQVLARRKGTSTVSVCLPARNEAATLAAIIDIVTGELMAGSGPDGSGPALVDELVVLDDGSTDATAAVAGAHGARVVAVDKILPELGAGRGKGNVLWRSLAVATGDLIVWCDADVTSFRADYVTGLLAPLLDDPAIGFVKGFYDRPTAASGHGGGRVTELVARPLLSRFFPGLATLRQPLAGEMAGRRSVLEAVPFVQGYGVETGLVIDIANRFGFDAVVQVDLGVRRHRHQPLDALAVQATEVLQVVLDRAGLPAESMAVELARADGSTVTVPLLEWPPMETVNARGVRV
ncbi:MAG: glucosyl-3-phosphoglycerate synthase [Acidimicrobiales bacterium]|nr:glucosyl-3-phosphoglycerate synthase [Acidimicrobiales bacterium]